MALRPGKGNRLSAGTTATRPPSRTGWPTSAILGILLALLPHVDLAQPAVQVGNVIAIHGDWVPTLGGAKSGDVKLGDPVFAGERIVARQPANANNSFITIALAGEPIHRICGAADPCEVPIVIADEPAPPPGYMKIVNAVKALLDHEVPHPMMTNARDVNGPRSAVVAQTADQVDLRPALRGMSEGAYLVELVPEYGGQMKTRLPAYPLTLLNGGPALISRGTMQPGIYRLTLVSSEEREPVGNTVVVLVTTAADFKTRGDDFARAQEMTSRWSREIPASTVQYFLDLYLRALANGALEKQ
jgi:hypothetical protein